MRWAILAAVVLTAGSFVAAVELSGRHETAGLAECARAASAIDRPATIPRAFPVPAGYEAFYSVKGYSGRYRVAEIRACPAATSFLITARPTLLGRGFSQ